MPCCGACGRVRLKAQLAAARSPHGCCARARTARVRLRQEDRDRARAPGATAALGDRDVPGRPVHTGTVRDRDLGALSRAARLDDRLQHHGVPQGRHAPHSDDGLTRGLGAQDRDPSARPSGAAAHAHHRVLAARSHHRRTESRPDLFLAVHDHLRAPSALSGASLRSHIRIAGCSVVLGRDRSGSGSDRIPRVPRSRLRAGRG